MAVRRTGCCARRRVFHKMSLSQILLDMMQMSTEEFEQTLLSRLCDMSV